MSSTKSRLDMTLDELAAEAKVEADAEAKANKASGGKRGRSEGETAPNAKRIKSSSGEDQAELASMATPYPTSGSMIVYSRDDMMRKVANIINNSMRGNRAGFHHVFLTEAKLSSSGFNDMLRKVPVHEMVRRQKEREAASFDKAAQPSSSGQSGTPASSGKSGKPANTGGETAPADKGKGKRHAPKLTKATKKTEEEKKKELDDDMDEYFARSRTVDETYRSLPGSEAPESEGPAGEDQLMW